MFCDFCASPKAVREYPAANFRPSHDPMLESIGAWMACVECARMIDGEAWDALAECSLTSPNGKRMVEVAGHTEALDWVKRFHQQFRENRVKA